MRRLTLLALAAALGLAVVATGAAQGEATVRIEVRVLQNVEDGREIHIGARPAAGSWRTLGRIPLALDDGFSPRGRYRYGDISVDVGLPNRSSPVTVHVQVWQDVGDDQNIYVSARGSLGEWDTLGTIALPLDDGLTPDRALRYGDVRLEVPFPEAGVRTLAGTPGIWGLRDGSGEHARFGGWSRTRALGLTVDRGGSVVVADARNHAIRRVAPDGVVTTVAGAPGWSGGWPAETARFNSPTVLRSVGTAPSTSPMPATIASARSRPMAWCQRSRGATVAKPTGWRYETVPAEQALFAGPTALVLDTYGDLYILERFAVRRLSPSGWVSTVAGDNGWGWGDGPTGRAQFQGLYDIAADDAGNLYVIDDSRGLVGSRGTVLAIRKIDTSGMVTTLYRDGHPALGGTLAYPSGLAVTGDGVVYLANTGRHQIVRLTAEGQLRAVAGTGEKGHLDGPHGAATFSFPRRMAFSPDGALIVG